MEENKNVLNPRENSEDINENIQQPENEESLADRVRIVSPGKLVAKRFFRSRLSMVGLCILIALFAFSFLGPTIAGWFWSWGETGIDMSVPSQKREIYITGKVQELLNESDIVNKEYVGISANKKDIYKVVLDGEVVYFVNDPQYGKNYYYRSDELGNIMEFSYTTYSWSYKDFNSLGPLNSSHLLGTDKQGMDVFIRLMYGGQVSLTLGFVVVILGTILGILMGGLAGYFGGWVDMLIMRIVDIFNCLPTMPILLIVGAVFDSMEIAPKMKIYFLMIIMTLLGWAGTARMVRGQILFLREQEFMVAAEALGLSVSRKIVRHLVPNIMPQLIVSMTLSLGSIILTESTLSYLGIGIPMPYAAWGTMISAAQDPTILENYLNLWIPAGCLIVLAVLAFNFVGDGLRDAFDPKASR